MIFNLKSKSLVGVLFLASLGVSPICGNTIKPLDLHQQQKKINGIVLDEFSQPLIGAQVQIKGTTRGVTTSIDGDFSLFAEEGDVLMISYMGYKTIEQVYKGEKIISIQMFPETELLDDVIVIGYGKQKKNSVVSSVNSIGTKELTVTASRNLTNALAGQIPGLISVQRSGEPGYDSSEFWIRGISSFSGGTRPLILVDGIPRSMQDIEPDEIESFTLLKDAAATAVYGAEGANGVILITTKRGGSQKPRISFRAEGTIKSPTRLPEFLNAEQTLTLYNEALQNEGKEAIYNPSLYGSGADRDLYPDTDWMDYMLRDVTYNTRYTLNVRGGTDRARYFVSGAFYKENGIFKQGNNNRHYID